MFYKLLDLEPLGLASSFAKANGRGGLVPTEHGECNAGRSDGDP